MCRTAHTHTHKKKSRKKMKKWQIENFEKLEILEKLFQMFLFPSFWFCPTAKMENSDLKISEKNFWDFWGFWVFYLADLLSTFGSGSSTKSTIPRNIFIFSCMLDAKPNFFVVHVEEPGLLLNSSWSHMKMCLKYLNHFPNTTPFSHWLYL